MKFIVGQRVKVDLEALSDWTDIPCPCFGHITEIGKLEQLDGKNGIVIDIWNPISSIMFLAFFEWAAEKYVEAVD